MTERDVKAVALRATQIDGDLRKVRYFGDSLMGGSLYLTWILPDLGRVKVWMALDGQGEIWIRPRIDDREDEAPEEEWELGKVVYVVTMEEINQFTWADLIMEMESPDESQSSNG